MGSTPGSERFHLHHDTDTPPYQRSRNLPSWLAVQQPERRTATVLSTYTLLDVLVQQIIDLSEMKAIYAQIKRANGFIIKQRSLTMINL